MGLDGLGGVRLDDVLKIDSSWFRRVPQVGIIEKYVSTGQKHNSAK